MSSPKKLYYFVPKKTVLFDLFFSLSLSGADGMDEHCCELSAGASPVTLLALCNPRTLGNLMCRIGYRNR